jgi:cytochrome c-type protein NapC
MSDDESRFWRRPRRWWLLGIPAGGFAMFVAGVLFWGAFSWTVEATNTEAFCISCHEMRAFVYEEYKDTIHYDNRTGVRAVCSDCHVPKQWHLKMARKIQATFIEVPHHLLGSISTPEKFEAKREQLAERVWKSMRASDSRECRNCHEMAHMDLEKQDRSAKRRHAQVLAGERDETCIDCHQGIAHKVPAGHDG